MCVYAAVFSTLKEERKYATEALPKEPHSPSVA